MALFVFLFLLFNNCITSLLGFSNNNLFLEIKSSAITDGQNVGFYKVDDTLNLTCIFRNESNLPDVILEWVVPGKAFNSQNRVIRKLGSNFIVLIIENLQEKDSGEYKCKAIHNGIPVFNSETSVKINVKNKKKECANVMFHCSGRICISKRYTCDGFTDCPHGEDESPSQCGPGNPCNNKLMCPDSRCIPFTWCCESHTQPNCTNKIKHKCCTHAEKLTRDVNSDLGYQYDQQKFSDVGFLQTTVYTVIGCAMAFMFIVTIIVIAICRFHVRRTLLPRCPSANRNLMLGRGGLQGNHLNDFSFYDLDLYFNRSGLNGNDLMSVNPLLVTYNINNGVQFVGRPIDPPPYCEIVTSPPKEGPPPPYASRENLSNIRQWPKPEEYQTEAARTVAQIEEPTESEALLGEAGSVDVFEQGETPQNENSSYSGSGEGVEKYYEDSSKESAGTILHSISSSHGVAGVGESKNSSVNILINSFNNSDSAPDERFSSEKVYDGESSSNPVSNVGALPQGGEKGVTDNNSFDSKLTLKNTALCKSYRKKM